MQSPGAPSSSRGKAPSPAPEGEPSGDPTPTPQPSLPEGCVKLGPDEVVIRKGILRGIKRGAELALKGSLPANFSAGSATAGDVPFHWILKARMMCTVPCARRISQIPEHFAAI